MPSRATDSLATIQAIAAQSFNSQRSLDQAQEAFSSRIVALAEAHDLLTRENWEGAELHDVTTRLAALHGGAARFELSGPSIRLSPKTALSLSMALHELATNAVKYGALSRQGGQVTITWSVDYSGVPRVTPLEKHLFACDEMSGFITAAALVRPSKSVLDLEPSSVIKRMKDKAFARQVPRDHLVRGAELMGLPLEEHVTNVIGFMRLQADALGLRGTL